MFSRSTIGDSRSINVIRTAILSDATKWSVTYDHHSDDRNIFIIQASGLMWLFSYMTILVGPLTHNPMIRGSDPAAGTGR
jgi:hypothetical protein